MNKDRIRMVRGYISSPPNPEADAAKEKFAAINAYITERGGWLVSVPGALEVTMECLPDSALPNDLRALGYDVHEVDDGERILPHQIVERFVRRADGELEPLTEGSTMAVAEVRTHAGICKVTRYALDIS
jgi:hypothetical protein